MYTYEYSEGTHISLHFKTNVHFEKLFNIQLKLLYFDIKIIKI